MTTAPDPARPPRGLSVGGYALRARLGEGGMGVVHLAQRPGERPVALKVLRPHIVGDEEARRRLEREVGSLSRVRSRRVAEIVDADPWGDVPFVATRYVPGLSVHDHVREEGPIVGDDLVWFADCLAEALAAVHAVGVLHRDVKPSNVLMEGRSPVLIDFGLARVADDPRLTHTGWLLGTPGYLAPEILHGEDATAAADLHSWAATVAYAATGRGPFGGGPAMAIMDRVRRGEHDLDGVDQRLQPLLEDCLDPDPRRRPRLPELREWLATLDPRRPDAHLAPHETPDPATMPLALAALAPTHDRGAETEVVDGPDAWADHETDHATDHETDDRSDEWEHPTTRLASGPATTTPYTQLASLPDAPASDPGAAEPGPRTFFDDWEDDGWSPTVADRVGTLERLRRSSLVLAGGLGAAAAVATAPYLAVLTLVVLTWLLRSMSLAGSAVGQRREQRGRKWYDGPLLLMGAPWYLVAAVPGTLLLTLWSLGVAAAVGLICYAAALSLPASLASIGGAFALGLWWGPGGSRVRGPVHRTSHPLASRPVAWALVTAALLGLAAGLGSAAGSGPSWSPASERPFADTSVPDWARW